MDEPIVDDFLAHFGKKGMKWGVRNDKPSNSGGSGGGSDGSGGSASGGASGGAGSSGGNGGGDKKLSRREVRKLNREGQEKFDVDKLNSIYKEAKAGGEQVLIESRFAGDGPNVKTVITGKQFVDHVEAGGLIAVRQTEVFARQAKLGEEFIINMHRPTYQPIKR